MEGLTKRENLIYQKGMLNAFGILENQLKDELKRSRFILRPGIKFVIGILEYMRTRK